MEASADFGGRLVIDALVEATLAAARPGGGLPHRVRVVTAPRVAMPAARLDARHLLLRADVQGVVHIVQQEETAARDLPSERCAYPEIGRRKRNKYSISMGSL